MRHYLVRPIQSGRGWEIPISWTHILRGLKNEGNFTLYDDEFYQWLRDEWNIEVSSSGENNSIAYIECDDQTITMLMIKYPSAFKHIEFINQK